MEEAPELLGRSGFGEFTLLTTERARDSAPRVTAAAAEVLMVPPGLVDELSADLLPRVGERPLVALGGGRVIDTAKAVAGASGHSVAALPTTLSGAELTPFHRTPKGVEGARLVRPSLVVADPGLMASQEPAALTASAMNALAHGMEALYTPFANPVAELSALRGAALIAAGLSAEPLERDDVTLGALLAGHASASTGIALHHAVCQTLVRAAGSPHAETNAVMLPHSARLMADLAPAALASLAGALGDPADRPEAAAGRIAELSARCGHTRLGTLGVTEEHLPRVAAAAVEHPAYANTPHAPAESELLAFVRTAV